MADLHQDNEPLLKKTQPTFNMQKVGPLDIICTISRFLLQEAPGSSTWLRAEFCLLWQTPRYHHQWGPHKLCSLCQALGWFILEASLSRGTCHSKHYNIQAHFLTVSGHLVPLTVNQGEAIQGPWMYMYALPAGNYHLWSLRPSYHSCLLFFLNQQFSRLDHWREFKMLFLKDKVFDQHFS